MNRRNYLFYLAILLAAIFVVVLIVIGSHSGPKKDATISSQTEIGPMAFDNTAELEKILLKKQFNVLLFGLSDFVHQNISSTATTGSITSSPKIEDDGSVTFDVQLNTPKKQAFSVNVNRSVFSQITISVPEHKYARAINVY